MLAITTATTTTTTTTTTIVSQAWSVTAFPSSKAELRHRLAAEGERGLGAEPPHSPSPSLLSPTQSQAPAPIPASPSPGQARTPQKCHMRCQETTFPVYFKTLSSFLFNVLKGYVLKRDVVK